MLSMLINFICIYHFIFLIKAQLINLDFVTKNIFLNLIDIDKVNFIIRCNIHTRTISKYFMKRIGRNFNRLCGIRLHIYKSAFRKAVLVILSGTVFYWIQRKSPNIYHREIAFSFIYRYIFYERKIW